MQYRSVCSNNFITIGPPSDFQGCLPHPQLVYLTSDLCFHNIVPLLKGICPKISAFGGFCFYLWHVHIHILLPPLHPLPHSLSNPSPFPQGAQSHCFHLQPQDGEVSQSQGERTPKYPEEKQKASNIISPDPPTTAYHGKAARAVQVTYI